ncbi:MAG: SatD family protein [Imperialibacter sp.]|uniref:SatD family protein n=1 Tax=Imperialibacter sp. TaxID=2038411 RepID=UPI0032EFD8E1
MYFVLMGDIVGSSEKIGATLMTSFKSVIQSANGNFSNQILSPLTITLGDEFQGVVHDLRSVIDIIFHIDQSLIGTNPEFRIRYSMQYGPIDTPVNKENAHGMLGEGLTRARKGLEEMKQKKLHYRMVTTDSQTDDMLNGLFRLYDSFYSDWSKNDREYLERFFEQDDYKWVGEQLSKDPSTVWRKRISLKLDEFNIAKELIRSTANAFE